MEYHDLGDLSKHLFKPLPEKDGCEIVFQILEGLYFMHKNEFAHRDLKPNVCYSILISNSYSLTH